MTTNFFEPIFPSDMRFYSEISANVCGINEPALVPLSDEFVRALRRSVLLLAEREKQLAEWLASFYSDFLKKMSENSDLVMKAYMIGGTALSVISLVATLLHSPLDFVTQSLLVGTMSGVGWNLADSVGGILATPRLFREAKDSVLDPKIKTALAWTNAIYFSSVLPALSIWGFATLIQSVKAAGIKAIVLSTITLGAATALASCAFGFAAGMFIVAAISGFAWYRAAQKSEPVVLLRDRLKQCDVLQKKINACADDVEKEKLHVKLRRIKLQAEALFYYGDTNDDTLKVKLTDDDRNHLVLKEAAIKVSTLSVDERDQLQNKQKALATYLIQKQQDKIKEKRFDTFANAIGGVGAVLGGLALLIPPAAIPLMIASVICFAISSAMKAYQLRQKYQLAKEKKKASLEEKDDTALVRDHFDGKEIEGLSEGDTKRIASMQCKSRLFLAKKQESQVLSDRPHPLSPGIQSAG